MQNLTERKIYPENSGLIRRQNYKITFPPDLLKMRLRLAKMLYDINLVPHRYKTYRQFICTKIYGYPDQN